MGVKTAIEWCDSTWNPTSGCTPISEGCKNCWARRMAPRLAGRCGYNAEEPFRVTFHPDQLDKPLRWKKPRRIAVSLMGDLFHEDIPDEWIARIWAVMLGCPQHIFLVLTKRPERMAAWLNRCGNGGNLGWITHDNTKPEKSYGGTGIIVGNTDNWPLCNVWLGTSVENQKAADERIPWLLKCPADARFMSMEPLLGPVDIPLYPKQCPNCKKSTEGRVTGLRGDRAEAFSWYCGRKSCCNSLPLPSVDWIICGGESGPHARPMHPDWVRSIRDQCQSAGVPFFFKQVGEWLPSLDVPSGYADTYSSKTRGSRNPSCVCNNELMVRVGKHAAGRLLDGKEHNEMPEVKP
jgi:protein gp37